MADILLVEDEANARQILSLGLNMQGHEVTACASAEEAERLMQTGQYDVVLTDLRMDGRDAGLDVIRAGRQLLPEARILLLTAYASADTAVAAMKEGAFDYLTKPVSSEELAVAVELALADGALSDSPHRARDGEAEIQAEMLIGVSEPMKRVRARLLRAAQSDFTVLISGESGTGKELAAQTIHKASARSAAPFVPVHCGAIPEGLFESELFGHRKGAFTGAERDRPGLIESANGGTLFLDEIGEMPFSVQVKLLRVLQERRVRRVGDDREHDVDVRVIAATNRDLEAEVRSGAFREDLFFRLNVVPVYMPPLRQRPEDIPVLARAIVRKWSGGRSTLSEGCLQRLSELPLPGNVRELENLLQRMLALSENGDLDTALLNELYSAASSSAEISLHQLTRQGLNLDEWLERVERQLIDEALSRSGGNITRAADELGISFRSLRYRLKKLGLSGDDE